TDSDSSATLKPEDRADLDNSPIAGLIGRERLGRVVANQAELNRIITAAFPKAMFVLLPLFAFFTNLAWRRKVPRYPAHLYNSLHLHAAWFGAFAVAKLASAPFPPDAVAIAMGAAVMIYLIWYVLNAFRKVFGDSWGK